MIQSTVSIANIVTTQYDEVLCVPEPNPYRETSGIQRSNKIEYVL